MTLLFIHGAGGDARAFLNQIAVFSDAVAMTLPGHRGDAGGPDSIAAFADHVVGQLDRYRWPSVVLCGHSMGGAIALETALRGDPRVAGVVTIASGARMRVAPAFLESMEGDFPSAARSFASYFFAHPDPYAVDEAVATMLAVGAEQTLRDLRACDAWDATERLGGLRVPLLAVGGDRDKLTPEKFVRFLADRVPDGEARILEETGHFAMVERPDETNAAIRAFVERIARR
ncbi:MAG TPA: alpha/beta hydrolase [Candidatus Acidoferrales bacterium]|nr:alpha/beta hydrolase [Candidatus Acidoferrales bacterium]